MKARKENMKFFTFKTKDTNNTINKNLENKQEYDITLTNPENVITPSIVLNSRGSFTENYAYIPSFQRYYFIREVTRVNRDLIQLFLEVDVLETYKEDILNSEGNVARHKTSNKYYDGGSYLTEERKTHKKHYSDKTPQFEETVLMTLIGG